jgi:D-glycero-D-manno-heptose 1,7-bisphosphate phosphatase
MKKPAAFIDRDGTINEQMGYINHLSRFKIIPGVPEAIRLLNDLGFLVIVITNQSGIARGYYSIDLVHQIHDLLRKTIKKEANATIDEILFCPHHPQGTVSEYTMDCDCRKPKTGLIKQACMDFEIDLTNSFVIGDMASDMELANQAGVKGIMVETGYGLGEIDFILPKKRLEITLMAENLLHAVRFLEKRCR